ncbi:MAG: hypothetical protein H7A30_02325 [Thermotogae bacterium]|nr:hypothetical protein [Thermotogota bacterium]
MKKLIFIIMIISSFFVFYSCIPTGLFTPLISNYYPSAGIAEFNFKDSVSDVYLSTGKGNIYMTKVSDKKYMFDTKKYDFTSKNQTFQLNYRTSSKNYSENVYFEYIPLQIIVIGGGDNNLNNNLLNDISEIRDGVENSKIPVTVTVIADYYDSSDRIITFTKYNGNFYYYTIDPLYYGLESEFKTADINSVKNYFNTVTSFNPETKKFLIFWDHGNAWLGESKSDYSLRSIMIDYSDSDATIKISEVKSLLEDYKNTAGKNIDVIGFDACNMAMTEIIYELADYTDYFVGSASPEPASGYDYNFISYFNGNISYLLDRLVYAYDNNEHSDVYYKTMVAIKTEGFRQFIKNNLKNISKDSLHNNAVYGLLNSDDFTDVNYVLNNYPDDMIINKSLGSSFSGYNISGYNISGIGIAYNITDHYPSFEPDYRELLFYKENQNWVEKYNLW